MVWCFVSSLGYEDDDQVDIDTYVDGDSQSLRESLQWEVASASPSPSDSINTNNSKLYRHSVTVSHLESHYSVRLPRPRFHPQTQHK